MRGAEDRADPARCHSSCWRWRARRARALLAASAGDAGRGRPSCCGGTWPSASTPRAARLLRRARHSRRPPMRRRSTCSSARCASGRRRASVRASRSSAWAGRGRTSRWCAALEAINGYNPLRIGFYDRLVLAGRVELAGRAARLPGLLRRLRLRARARARARIRGARPPIEEVPHLAHRPVADVLLAGPTVWIYRLRDPAPRLKFTTPHPGRRRRRDQRQRPTR